MLNSTLLATSGVICCILHKYQAETAITVLDDVQPPMGMYHIPFVRDARNLKTPKSE
jgi:seryl-tRNA synthetase